MSKIRIGIDIGNVIIGGEGEDTTFFTDEYLTTPCVKDAISSVRDLNKIFDVWLVSKCGPSVEAKTQTWLQRKGFFELTGVKPEQVIFCRKRPQKVGIAANLELRAFIDDREDIIESMQGTVDFPILFTSWAEVKVPPVAWFS